MRKCNQTKKKVKKSAEFYQAYNLLLHNAHSTTAEFRFKKYQFYPYHRLHVKSCFEIPSDCWGKCKKKL